MTLQDLELTPEQRAIVTHPLEPLRIAAGAGTGKTTTVVARLVSLIRNHGISPESALGMTFTNKAAAELADRIRRELPDLAADGREIEVTTYHGFGLRILSEFGAVVGVERDISVIGAGYVRQLLTESVGDQNYAHLDMTKAKQRLDDAANLRSQMAENLLSVDRLFAIEPSVGGAEHEHRLELARILRTYEAHKRDLSVVDYGDLIALTHRLVTNHPEIAQRVRDRYAVVLLDEYQDTDPAQRELLRAIFDGGFPITAVGDSDQTIYEWRGASLENFANFPEHFPTGEGSRATTLPLTLNRRSDRAILDIANGIRRQIAGDGDYADGALALSPRPDATEGEVAVGWFRTEEDEAQWLAQEVQRLGEEEAVPWNEIAILFRRNSSMAVVGHALRNAGVPYEVASLGGLLTVPEVADVHAWLAVLGRPEDSASLARILLGSRYRLGLGDLAPMARWVRTRRRFVETDDDVAYPMLEAIDYLHEVDGLSPEAERRLVEFRLSYTKLLRLAQSVTLSDLVRRIIDEIEGWSEIAAMDPTRSVTARLNLYRLIDLTESWSPLIGRPSLEAFLDYLDLLEEEATAQELDTARIGVDNAVSLLTVHRSKGLEWDTVFLPALAARVFPSDSRAFDRPAARARWLPYELRLDQDTFAELPMDDKTRTAWLRKRHRSQEDRTAYVAVTRARRRLNMTGSIWAGRVERPRAPSDYLELARSSPRAREVVWTEDPGERPTFRTPPDVSPDPLFVGGWQAAVMTTIEDPAWPERSADDDAAFVEHRDQMELMLDGLPPRRDPIDTQRGVTTSVTGLTTLAACPRRFYWSEIDPLPRRPSPALRRGTKVHRIIEMHHRGIASFDDLAEDVPGIADDPSAPVVDPVEVFLATRFAAMRPVLIEAPIDIDIAGVRVRGRVDAVFEPEPGVWEIVDYKSGHPSVNEAASVQLDAYAVAAADGAFAQRKPDAIRTTFAFLGVDPAGEETTTMTPDRMEHARDRLERLATEATGNVFLTAPSDVCRNCPFSDVCDDGTTWLAANPRSN